MRTRINTASWEGSLSGSGLLRGGVSQRIGGSSRDCGGSDPEALLRDRPLGTLDCGIPRAPQGGDQGVVAGFVMGEKSRPGGRCWEMGHALCHKEEPVGVWLQVQLRSLLEAPQVQRPGR